MTSGFCVRITAAGPLGASGSIGSCSISCFAPLDLRRVLVGDGEPLDRALVADDVDHAPVGERRNDERRDVRERRLVVQRRRELLAGFGDQATALGKALLLLVHRGRPDRGGGEVRDCSGSAEVGVVEVPRPASVEDDRSDHLAPVAQRLDEEGACSLGRVGGLVLVRQPLGGRDVVHDQRTVERHVAAIAVDRRRRRGDVGIREACARLHRPASVSLVDAPERVGVRVERRLGELEHVGQHGGQVQRSE